MPNRSFLLQQPYITNLRLVSPVKPGFFRLIESDLDLTITYIFGCHWKFLKFFKPFMVQRRFNALPIYPQQGLSKARNSYHIMPAGVKIFINQFGKILE